MSELPELLPSQLDYLKTVPQAQIPEHMHDQALQVLAHNGKVGTVKESLAGSPESGDRIAAAPAASTEQPKEWLVVLDLALNFRERGPLGHRGADTKLKLLETLAAQTKDKPVVIVAQRLTRSADDKSNIIERYEIKDGKINCYQVRPSHGIGPDLQGLLGSALKRDPAKKVALLIDSHGSGNLGISGGNSGLREELSESTMPQVAKAIKAGLKAGHRDELDLLDFDSCMMSQTGVADATYGLAKHLVASTEIESGNASGLVDGQNHNALVKALLKNPAMNGDQLAETLVENARRGENGRDVKHAADGKDTLGTPTLSHLDLEHGYCPFRIALDSFGHELSVAIHNPANRNEINRIIEETPGYGNYPDTAKDDDQKRDLKVFAEQVRQSILMGNLRDPGGKLLAATRNVLSAEHGLVKSYFGAPSWSQSEDSDRSYHQEGGLSVFLPYRHMDEVNDRALNSIDTGRFLSLTNEHVQQAQRRQFLKNVDSYMPYFEKEAKDYPGSTEAMQELRRQMKALHQNAHGTEVQFEQSKANVHEAARRLLQCPPFIRELERARNIKENYLPDTYRQVEGEGGWKEFISTLRPAAKKALETPQR